MNLEKELELKTEKNLSREIFYRDITEKDAEGIIGLIRDVYEESYIDKEYYEIDIIKEYIRRTQCKREGVWKGAFKEGKLIGQMLAIFEKGACFVKLAMIQEKYKNLKIIKKLSILMVNEINNFNESFFKVIYAFIDGSNVAMQKILNNAQLKIYGSVPAWDNDHFYIIYGRIVFNFEKIVIKPHKEIYKEISETLNNGNIPRVIENDSANYQLEEVDNIISFEIIKLDNFFPKIYHIIHQNKVIAKFYENNYNKSWYNFTMLEDQSIKFKTQIIKKIIDFFYKNQSINSFSLSVNVNDREFQDALLKSNLRYYAYLPCFNFGRDEILFGVTKVKDQDLNGGVNQ